LLPEVAKRYHDQRSLHHGAGGSRAAAGWEHPAEFARRAAAGASWSRGIAAVGRPRGWMRAVRAQTAAGKRDARDGGVAAARRGGPRARHDASDHRVAGRSISCSIPPWTIWPRIRHASSRRGPSSRAWRRRGQSTGEQRYRDAKPQPVGAVLSPSCRPRARCLSIRRRSSSRTCWWLPQPSARPAVENRGAQKVSMSSCSGPTPRAGVCATRSRECRRRGAHPRPQGSAAGSDPGGSRISGGASPEPQTRAISQSPLDLARDRRAQLC